MTLKANFDLASQLEEQLKTTKVAVLDRTYDEHGVTLKLKGAQESLELLQAAFSV